MPTHAARGVRQSSHSDTQAQQSGVLKVTTAEGDVVTISFGAMEQARSDSRFRSTPGGYSASYGSSASASMSVGVQIEGSLSDKEVADITALMGHLGAAIEDSRSGDSAKLAGDVAAAGKLQSIQGFQFAYQESYRGDYNTITRVFG